MQQTEWGPSTAGLIFCGALGFVLAVVSVTQVTDPPGRIMAGIAGVGLIVFAGFSLRARPRLAITQDGLMIRGWWHTRNIRRADIELIRITEFRRIARKVRLLEIDLSEDQGRSPRGETLVVLSRWDLGTDPLSVLDALTAAGYAGPPASP
ncbi:MAG: PH domain-containing protein [Mycobacteriaceae bacterium]|nr:PH domain-containing protein [Mycobacteriaceae bacterium]